MSTPGLPKIKLECPKCLQRIEFAAEMGGQRAACPICQFSLMLPSASAGGLSYFDDLFGDDAAPTKKPTDSSLPFEDLDVDNLQHTSEGKFDQLPAERLNYLEAVQQLPPVGSDPFSEHPAAEESIGELEQSDMFAFSSPHAPAAESIADTPVDAARFDAMVARDVDPLRLDPISDDDPLSLEALSGAPPLQLGGTSSTTPGSDPFAEDPDAPLRIDGISEMTDPNLLLAVRCPICDSRIMVGPQYAGTQATCPDCFSRVDIPAETPKPTPVKTWTPVARTTAEEVLPKATKSDDALSLSPIESLPDEYGLAPIDEDLLKPKLADNLLIDEQARAELAGIKPVRGNEPVGRPANKTAPASPPDSSNGPRVAVTSPKPVSPAAGSIPGGTRSSVDKAQYRPSAARPENTTPTENEDEDKQKFPIKFSEFWADSGKMSQWVQRLLTDPELILRCGGAALALALSYWFGSLIGGIILSDANQAYKFTAVLGLGLIGVVCMIGAFYLGVMSLSLIFQLGTEKYARHSAWPGFGLGEWGGAALYVVITTWLASLPGAAIGSLFLLAFDSWLALFVIASISVFLIQPLLLSHAYYNGSAWQLFSRDLLPTLSTQDVDWLRYVPGSLIAVIGVSLGFLLVQVSGFWVCLIAAAIQMLTLVIYFSTTGLYCHLMAEKVETMSPQPGKR